MNIIQTLERLRDDIKLWVTNNLNALNAKIDEKTIPIDSKLESTSSNPVQNKVVKAYMQRKSGVTDLCCLKNCDCSKKRSAVS